jgi:group I intron endonuclease
MDKISGIYKIESRIKPERCYIGSSIDINNRWMSHLNTLRDNSHHNKKLQNHYNKYGVSDLLFSIILYGCKKDDLIFIEQVFLNTCKPWFNIRKIANSNLGLTHSIESKIMIGDSHRGRKYKPRSEETSIRFRAILRKSRMWYHPTKETIEKQRNSLYKPILYYDIYGNFIKEFPTVLAASKELLIPVQAIYYTLKRNSDDIPAFIYKKNIS